MIWYNNLYVSKKACGEKLRRFGRMRSTFAFDAYIIILPSNDENLLEIITYKDAIFYKAYEDAFAVGIAVGKQDAIELVSDILWDVYKKTGSFRVKDYIGVK